MYNRILSTIRLGAILPKYTAFWWVLATVLYLCATLIVMGNSLTSCTDTVYGYSWDGSGGLAWFQWADGGGPRWGFTDKSNFPFGEKLDRPNFITSYALFMPYSLVSLLSNQVCGLNIMTAFGFMSAALVMFGLVRWLTRSSGAALFAGLAAGFVPFHQFQAQGHIAYGYNAIFIAIIWAFLCFARKPNVKRGLIVGLLYTLSLYMDGYFILLSTALLGLLIAAYLIREVCSVSTRKRLTITIDGKQLRKNIKQIWLPIVVTLAVVIVLLTPIAYRQLKHGGEIQTSLANARSDITGDALSYGARISDFILPSVRSAFVNSDYVNWRTAHMHESNPYESTLYVGIVILALSIFTIVALFTKKFKKDVRPYRPVIIMAIIIAFATILLSFPPYLTIGTFHVTTPTGILIQITANWRVFSRFFMIIHPVLVLMAAIGLTLLIKKLSKRWKIVVVSVAILITGLEYYSVRTPNWSYKNNTPKVYSVLAKDPSVNVIAEYPITDFPSATLPYTFTFQQVHGKKLLDANDSNTNQRTLRQSIAGLDDAQTLGVLRELGIDTVTTLNINANSVTGLRQYADPSSVNDQYVKKVYSYRIENGDRRPYALITVGGIVTTLDSSGLRSQSSMVNAANLAIDQVHHDESIEAKQFTVSFKASATNNGVQKLIITQRDKTLWSGTVEQGTPVEFAASGYGDIHCEVPGQSVIATVSLSDLQVNP